MLTVHRAQEEAKEQNAHGSLEAEDVLPVSWTCLNLQKKSSFLYPFLISSLNALWIPNEHHNLSVSEVWREDFYDLIISGSRESRFSREFLLNFFAICDKYQLETLFKATWLSCVSWKHHLPLKSWKELSMDLFVCCTTQLPASKYRYSKWHELEDMDVKGNMLRSPRVRRSKFNFYFP